MRFATKCFFIIVHFLLIGCETWDFERKAFLKCTKPTAQLSYTADKLSVKFELKNVAGDFSQVTWKPGTDTTIIGTEKELAFVYTRPGSFNVSVELSNKCGDIFKTTAIVSVTNLALPSVTTLDPSAISSNAATLRNVVTEHGNAVVAEYGVCYSVSATSPTVDNSTVVSTKGGLVIGNTNSFEATNLKSNSLYYIRAFAINEVGVNYGEIITFKTLEERLPDNGLVAHYPLNGNAVDIVGNNNGKLMNGSSTEDRKARAGDAIWLDGVNSFVEIPDNPVLQFSNAMTISIWAKPTGTSNEPAQLLVKSRYTGGEEQYSINIRPIIETSSTTYVVNFDLKQNSNCNSGTGWQNASYSLQQWPDKWHHIVCVYESKTMLLYLDGNLVRKVDNLPQPFLDNCPGGDVRLGLMSQEYPFRFQGAVDDLRFYNRALSVSEIQSLYNQ